MRRLLLVLVATASLAGCLPPPPAYKDPLSGIMPIAASAVPQNAPVKVEQPAALIVSDNTEAFLQYATHSDQINKSAAFLVADNDALNDLDPRPVVSKVTALLKARYPQIELVDDMNAAQHANKRTVFVVDIKAVIGQIAGDATKVDITLLVFDPQRRAVSKIGGHGEVVMPFPATESLHFQEASAQALRQLDQTMTRYFR